MMSSEQKITIPDKAPDPVGVAAAARRQRPIKISGDHVGIFGLGMP